MAPHEATDNTETSAGTLLEPSPSRGGLGGDGFTPVADSDTGAARQSASLAEDSRLAAALAGPHRAWALLVFFGLGLGWPSPRACCR